MPASDALLKKSLIPLNRLPFNPDELVDSGAAACCELATDEAGETRAWGGNEGAAP